MPKARESSMRARDVCVARGLARERYTHTDVIHVFKWTAGRQHKQGTAMTVDLQIANIKAHMPRVYQAIEAKANNIGKLAFAWVRRGLRGEPNCFYAFEAGYVVGTPFNRADIMPEIARYMVQFGCDHIVVFADEGQFETPPKGAAGGIPTPSTPPIGTPGGTTHAGNSTPAAAPVDGLGKSPLNGPKVGG